MSKEAIDIFLAQFSELTENEKKELATKLTTKSFNKKNVVQELGKIPTHCFFVLKGLVRECKIVDGIEKTVEFYSESHPAIPSECYMKKIPSDTFLECVEDSLLFIGDHDNESKSIEDIPALKTIMMRMAEEEWIKAAKKLATFKIQSPEKRYLSFLEERSDLKNRVSGIHIANYLGITPESFSRIKKRLIQKEKKR
ncbi:Crp/Fnr family transcriptional regulator [Kordia sp.]|uniref:Crp/Fnr family transcriptional regulator n=1 Tax=Kordia sp. TaxID=1965332 RepID=UPI003D6A929B